MAMIRMINPTIPMMLRMMRIYTMTNPIFPSQEYMMMPMTRTRTPKTVTKRPMTKLKLKCRPTMMGMRTQMTKIMKKKI
eukprot:scaffold25220_cov34-Attheya_sp.AAC.2